MIIYVSGSAYGFDDFGLVVIEFDFRAELGDVHINRARAQLSHFFTPDGIIKFFAAEDAVGMSGETLDQLGLALADFYHLVLALGL